MQHNISRKVRFCVHFESMTLPPHKYIDRSQRTQLNTVDICLVAVEFITKSDVVSMAR
jgi:hypothetical protein